jgi:hypothetical protein
MAHPNTLVLLFFGDMKLIKNVTTEDMLIGPNNEPRVVLSNELVEHQPIYKIVPEIGESFIIGLDQVISVYCDGRELELPFSDYLNMPDTWKINCRLRMTAIDYTRNDTSNDPYLIGILLSGDYADVPEVIRKYLEIKLDFLDAGIQSDSKFNHDEIEYLLDNKYIPNNYLYNCKEIRLRLLKGLCNVFSTRDTARSNISRSSSGSRSSVRSASSTRKSSRSDIKTRKTSRSKSIKAKSYNRVKTPTPTRKTSTTPTRKTSKSPKTPTRKASKSPKTPTRKASTTPTRKASKSPKTPTRKASTTPTRKASKSPTKKPTSKYCVLKSLVFKDKILRDQIKFLIRSLGIRCVEVNDTLNLDTEFKCESLCSSFSFVPYDTSDVYNILLDKDNQYLLSSCIISNGHRKF